MDNFGKAGEQENDDEVKSMHELSESRGEQKAARRSMQNRVGTSGRQNNTAIAVESSSIDENTKTLKDLVQLLAIKFGAEEQNSGCSITAESFAKIIPEFDGESIPVKYWFDNFEQNVAAYGLNIKQMYVQARAKMVNTAKLFLESTFVHQYAEMRMLMETEFSRQYVCSADVHEQLRTRKKRKDESFHVYLLQMKKIASLGNIDVRSVIRYVVDGLSMRSDFRYSLYCCKTYKELQEQYEVYERVGEKPFKPNNERSTPDNRMQREFNHRKNHCFNCGSADHLRKDCRAACKSHEKGDHQRRGSGVSEDVPRSCVGLEAEVAVDQELTTHNFVVVEDADIEYDALLGFDFVSKFNFSLSADGYKFSSQLEEKACEKPKQYDKEVSELIKNYKAVNTVAEVPVKMRKKVLKKPPTDGYIRILGYEGVTKKLTRCNAGTTQECLAETPRRASLKSDLASNHKLRELRKAQIDGTKKEKSLAKKECQLLQKKSTHDEILARCQELAFMKMSESQKSAIEGRRILKKKQESRRKDTKREIQRAQELYRRNFDRKRKPEVDHKVVDLVAIRRTQFVAGKKLAGEYMGPYAVAKVKRNGRYEVRKAADFEGPINTSTSCDYIKLWRYVQDNEDDWSSGTDE
ncbi:uncharacterized protein [Drosophila kikkawai]|uniref:CCHC-type domain-containing protein n=1 Tax=Drosophila kikkawai TaxID=30033 RepID=A0ABM4GFY4_DROKI